MEDDLCADGRVRTEAAAHLPGSVGCTTAAFGANGTSKSLFVAQEVESFFRDLDGARPGRIAFWLRLASQSNGWARIQFLALQGPVLSFVYDGQTFTSGLKPKLGQWYHVEFRDLDWQLGRANLAIDGALRGPVTFETAGVESVRSIDIRPNRPGTTLGSDTWWDEIRLE